MRARRPRRPALASLLRRHGLVARDCARLTARSEAHPAATLRVSRADVRRLAARSAGRPCGEEPIVALFSVDEPVVLRSQETLLVCLPQDPDAATGPPAATGPSGTTGPAAALPLVLAAHSQYTAGLRAGAVHRALVYLEWA